MRFDNDGGLYLRPLPHINGKRRTRFTDRLVQVILGVGNNRKTDIIALDKFAVLILCVAGCDAD